MIVKKNEEKKIERPDYGQTFTPKQSAEMLTFLTDEVDIVSTEGICARPRNDTLERCRLCIRPRLFTDDENGRKLSRYEISEVCCLRDCLTMLLGKREGPANLNGTITFSIYENNPMHPYMLDTLRHIDPHDKSEQASEMRRLKEELDELLGDVLEYYRCHLEIRSSVVMIVPDYDRGW